MLALCVMANQKIGEFLKRLIRRKSPLSKLKHTIVPIVGGGEVFVLDNGAVIDSEAEAMLQALHSRSTGGIKHHLQVLADKGPEDFMSRFYVGYNHKSIGDCGTTTTFIEGVSMLTAKAIQDFALYAGQESSTRYIDFSKQRFIDPTNTTLGNDLLEMQRRFYINAREPTVALLREKYPIKEGEKQSVYDKAIDARAFDITRCLLPAGASTNLAWHGDLRHIADRLLFLRHHPLEEVRNVANALETAMQQKHKSSFGHKKYPATEEYQDVIAGDYYFHNSNSPVEPRVDFSRIDFNRLREQKHLFNLRPQKTELPKYLAEIGSVSVDYTLDFGSFRDIQRHRAISQRMPLLTSDLGFNQWYVDNLPEQIVQKLPDHLVSIRQGVDSLGISPQVAQYFMPMGYNTSNRFIGDLPATVYMVELRDASTVHPTLQRVAHSIAGQIQDRLGIPLHLDPNPGRFNIKRGEHDISLKE